MQPYLFPYIGYFQLMNAVDKFVILDDVNFVKRGWINRNRILVNGKAHLFTIPLKGASQNKNIKDIQISDEENRRDKLLKTIKLNYKKAPFFSQDVSQLVKSIISSQEKLISRMIVKSIEKINNYLNIKTIIIESSDIYNNLHLKREDRIIDICLQEKASHYINLIGGKDIYSKEAFLQKGIILHFLQPELVSYKQSDNEFIPGLSIVDVLMFNGKSDVKQFLKCYTLI